MSILGSIVSDISKAVTDPGALISGAAKAILPKNMAGIGDLLGGIADIETGHPLQALSHITDALKDLPQLLQGQAGAQPKAAATPAGTAGAEPSPPPQRGAHPLANSAAAALAGNAPPVINSAPPAPAVAAGAAPTTGAAPAASATPATGAAPATTPSTPATSASPTPAAPAPSTATPPASTAVGQAPSVTVRRFGKETVTRVDDGQNTTIIEQRGRRTTVSVRSDVPPSRPGGAAPAASTGSASASSPASSGSAQAPSITVEKLGRETITRVDDGTSTTTIDQKGRRTTVSVSSDQQAAGGYHPAPPLAGPAAGASAPATTGNASTVSSSPTGGSTPSTSSATIASATPTSGSAAATSSTTTPKNASASSATGTGDSSASASGSSAGSPKDLAGLMALSPDQFMQAVTSGKIPPDVANNQSAMMQVQARMNQITQMNQLVTSMMAAMHQMQMSIIQNIRC